MNPKSDFSPNSKTPSQPLVLLLECFGGPLCFGRRRLKVRDETEVQFSCKIADTTVRVGFKPRDIVDASGPAQRSDSIPAAGLALLRALKRA